MNRIQKLETKTVKAFFRGHISINAPTPSFRDTKKVIRSIGKLYGMKNDNVTYEEFLISERKFWSGE